MRKPADQMIAPVLFYKSVFPHAVITAKSYSINTTMLISSDPYPSWSARPAAARPLCGLLMPQWPQPVPAFPPIKIFRIQISFLTIS